MNMEIEPQYLLIWQIQQNAASIEQYLRCVYDPQVPYEYKKVAIQYLYAQNRQIKDLADSLFQQFHVLERL
jgi:hypothetical protein